MKLLPTCTPNGIKLNVTVFPSWYERLAGLIPTASSPLDATTKVRAIPIPRIFVRSTCATLWPGRKNRAKVNRLTVQQTGR